MTSITKEDIKELMELRDWSVFQLSIKVLHRERTVRYWVKGTTVPNLAVQQVLRKLLNKARADKAKAEGE